MRRRLAGSVSAALVVIGVAVGPARADFPYPRSGDPRNPASYRLAPGVTPREFNEIGDWKLSATPSNDLASLLLNGQPDELCGVRGASIVDAATVQPSGCLKGQPVHTAWQVTTGRPDVSIAVLDSGIEWNDPSAMADLRDKVRLNQGELPAPRHDLVSALVPGLDCAGFANPTGGDYNPRGNYDIAGTGVFNVIDYACDSRVAAAMRSPLRHGPPGVLTPEDLIIAFSDGIDHDHNGYVNDIAGWNFVDNTNDPFDDVQYGHGTGEARDSTAEANNGGDLGTCPNCMVLPLRVGESFVADANRFAEAAIYATDSGVDVIQEALGSLNGPLFARQAIDYAYNHGVTVIASAADEAAEHHNLPGALPHAIVVNSVEGPATEAGVPVTNVPPSYLQLNGCTNFGTRIDLAVPSSSCSSEAAGKSAGVAGLIYSAAENARDAGRLAPSTDCRRVDSSPCVITPNEVRQLMASGNIGGTTPADAGNGGQADDVNTALQPEASCTQLAVPTCTDPNLNTAFAVDELLGVIGPLPDTFRYPSRKGFDEFFGYGRLNAYRAVAAANAAMIPPQAEISSPDWFQQLDPGQPQIELDGHLAARGPYTCEIDVAPGAEPNNAPASASPAGDFVAVPSSVCDGRIRSAAYSGVLAELSTAQLERLFPAGNPTSFSGNENGGRPQTSFGRPNTMPYAFTVRVVVTTAAGAPMTGEDRRQLFLHRDQAMVPGWPKELRTDGDSSPVLVDLDGDNRNELIVATSDGLVHAYRRDGSELPGWPVHTERLPLHLGEPAFAGHALAASHYAAIVGGLAAGDLFGDGRIEIVADDVQGNVYAWDAAGRLVFHTRSNPAYSGAPLRPFATVRSGPRDRTEAGFLGSPVLAHLDTGSGLEVIAAGEDRHVYAWRADGTPLAGFPVLVADPAKLAAVDPTTNHLTFNGRVSAHPGISEDQGKLIDTPAVADINGSGHPSIIVGSNEEYPVGYADEGPINAGLLNTASLGVVGQLGILGYANGRVYAIRATGGTMRCSGGGCTSTAFLPGWPTKIGIIDRGLLPDVGEGINGSPVVAPLTCPSGGSGQKVAVTPDAGPAYILNADGSSCYGSSGGQAIALQTDIALSTQKVDTPAFPAVGYPAFGALTGSNLSLFAPASGLIRALDVVAPDYQKGGQDFLAAWDPGSGQFRLGFPSPNNDLSFLTGEVVGDILGKPGQQQALLGTASLDLQAYDSNGLPASAAWPKLTGDWIVATPVLGSFGTLDSDPAARKDVVSITRAGTLSVYSTPAAACSPSSWPNFHHDIANSGDYTREAVPPGVPMDLVRAGSLLAFTAPGNQLLCGTARAYQLVTSRTPITPQTFASATPLPGVPAPAAAGTRQSVTLPAGVQQYVAIRALGDQGNIGRPAVACTAELPVSGVDRPRRLAGGGLILRGRSTDRSCGSARLRLVRVALFRRAGARCRFADRRGRLGAPRSCRRAVLLRVSLRHGAAGRKLRWSLRLPGRLPAGRYVIEAVARDAAGRVERPHGRDRLTLSLHA